MPLAYDSDDPAVRAEMDAEAQLIERLPFVRHLTQLEQSRAKGAGFMAQLWCYAGRESEGSCGKKQEPPVHITQSRTTLLGCLRELRTRLEQLTAQQLYSCCGSSQGRGRGPIHGSRHLRW